MRDRASSEPTQSGGGFYTTYIIDSMWKELILTSLSGLVSAIWGVATQNWMLGPLDFP